MDVLEGTVDETGHEVLGLIESGELEADDHAAVGEAGIVMDVGGMAGLLGRAGDLHDPGVEVGLFELGDAVGRSAFPTVTDALESGAGLLALEGVVEDQRAFGLQPGGVVGRGEVGCHEAEKQS